MLKAVVRLQRWTREKSMSFVPPDGHFVLAEYRYAPNAGSPNSALKFGASPSSSTGAPPSKEFVSIPFAIKAKFEIEETTGAEFRDVRVLAYSVLTLGGTAFACSLLQHHIFLALDNSTDRERCCRVEPRRGCSRDQVYCFTRIRWTRTWSKLARNWHVRILDSILGF